MRSTSGRVKRIIAVLALLCACASPFAFGELGHAQDPVALMNLLRRGTDFRVRANAALSLGRTTDQRARIALELALRDPNASVRAACAQALGRIADARSIDALEQLRQDPSPFVRTQAERALESIRSASFTERGGAPSALAMFPTHSQDVRNLGDARYLVVLGSMENRSGYSAQTFPSLLRNEVARHLGQIPGVLAIDSGTQAAATLGAQASTRRIPKLRIDGSLMRLDRQTSHSNFSVRCEVSLLLLQEPDLLMRGVLTGAAATNAQPRAVATQERHLAEQALSGAVRSAMSRAEQALARAAGI